MRDQKQLPWESKNWWLLTLDDEDVMSGSY